ncbi:hypothetical protein COLO4_30215 [Corchorus olitorius]|uniref:Retrotransposon gag protein n=1 Tax=Corchorus olitorius TaxID=93759 RepID=A0A1R3H9X4_9ROSI|nr:hypothetical protein COLO4_30215 [Corchorus olitorius]
MERIRCFVRKEILSCRQLPGEQWYKYWKRYNETCKFYVNHGIPERQLIKSFYDGLSPSDQTLINAIIGRSLEFESPEHARRLLSKAVEDSQVRFTPKNSTAYQTAQGNGQRLNRFDRLNQPAGSITQRVFAISARAVAETGPKAVPSITSPSAAALVRMLNVPHPHLLLLTNSSKCQPNPALVTLVVEIDRGGGCRWR